MINKRLQHESWSLFLIYTVNKHSIIRIHFELAAGNGY